MPISVYNVIQTGPNSQLGGVNAGFVSSGYQLSTEPAVKTDPMIPANCDKIMNPMRTKIFLVEDAAMAYSPGFYCDCLHIMPGTRWEGKSA